MLALAPMMKIYVLW